MKKKTATFSTPSEKEIENAIFELLNRLGWFAWKNNSTGIYDPKIGKFRKSKNKNVINGASDILAIKNGIVLFIEVKSLTGRMSEDQEIFRDNIVRSGGYYYVVRSCAEVLEIVSRHQTH